MARILLVEDDAMVRDMLSRRLIWEGHQVVTATDGAQAVAMAHVEHPDVILMDMGLPVLNGWQATQRIKASPDTRTIPIIAVTAFATREDQIKCLKMGCDAYESKPVDFARLLTKMQLLLPK
jgi:two-component system cell cycle response regulator DivK